jgi:hypothetical protein
VVRGGWLEELRTKVSGSNPSTIVYHKKREAGAGGVGFTGLKQFFTCFWDFRKFKSPPAGNANRL